MNRQSYLKSKSRKFGKALILAILILGISFSLAHAQGQGQGIGDGSNNKFDCDTNYESIDTNIFYEENPSFCEEDGWPSAPCGILISLLTRLNCVNIHNPDDNKIDTCLSAENSEEVASIISCVDDSTNPPTAFFDDCIDINVVGTNQYGTFCEGQVLNANGKELKNFSTDVINECDLAFTWHDARDLFVLSDMDATENKLVEQQRQLTIMKNKGTLAHGMAETLYCTTKNAIDVLNSP